MPERHARSRRPRRKLNRSILPFISSPSPRFSPPSFPFVPPFLLHGASKSCRHFGDWCCGHRRRDCSHRARDAPDNGPGGRNFRPRRRRMGGGLPGAPARAQGGRRRDRHRRIPYIGTQLLLRRPRRGRGAAWRPHKSRLGPRGVRRRRVHHGLVRRLGPRPRGRAVPGIPVFFGRRVQPGQQAAALKNSIVVPLILSFLFINSMALHIDSHPLSQDLLLCRVERCNTGRVLCTVDEHEIRFDDLDDHQEDDHDIVKVSGSM